MASDRLLRRSGRASVSFRTVPCCAMTRGFVGEAETGLIRSASRFSAAMFHLFLHSLEFDGSTRDGPT